MKTYQIKITGSGTAEQIASRLYEIVANIYGNKDTDITMKSEDSILFTEIAEE